MGLKSIFGNIGKAMAAPAKLAHKATKAVVTRPIKDAKKIGRFAKKMIIVLAIIGLPSLASSQITAFPGQSLVFDYDTAIFNSAQVVRFEMKADTGAYVSILIPSVITGAPTGFTRYQTPLPALTPGNHTLTVRACNTSVCGPDASPLGFAFVVIVQPVNLGIR